MSELQKNLIVLMKENNLFQSTLANKIGISQQTMSSYINGKSEPRATEIIKLAKLFNISTDELLGVKKH